MCPQEFESSCSYPFKKDIHLMQLLYCKCYNSSLRLLPAKMFHRNIVGSILLVSFDCSISNPLKPTVFLSLGSFTRSHTSFVCRDCFNGERVNMCKTALAMLATLAISRMFTLPQLPALMYLAMRCSSSLSLILASSCPHL